MAEKNETMTTTELLFALLRSEICDTQEVLPDVISKERLNEIYHVSNRHDVAHIISSALQRQGFLKDNEVSRKFLAKQMLSVYRYEQLRLAFDEICFTLEKALIPFIPLKGSVLRDYYPEPWMRTSCDIDILVHKEDLEKATLALTNECNYIKQGIGSHDISLFTQNNVHIELHYNLVEDAHINKSVDVLKNVWSDAKTKEGAALWHELSDEMFYFYHIAHIAKHFLIGGCGIRPLIDLFILDGIKDADFSKRDELLSRGDLLEFANAARKLSRIWFSSEQRDFISQQMENYILRGGVYGSNENRITVQQQKKGGRVRYALYKIFLPYSVIKFHYPILQKYRWLTPLMEIRRWCKLIFCGHLKRTAKELRYNNNISNEEATNMKMFLKDIGL